MHPLLAYADPTDLSDATSSLVLIILALLVAAALLAIIPIALAHARWHHHSRAILLSTLLWAFLAAGSSILTAHAHLKWSKDDLSNIKTGYLDPADTTGQPGYPWPLWIILALAYLALLIFALSQNNRPTSNARPDSSQPE